MQTLPTKAPEVEIVCSELVRWEKNFIDVSSLKTRAEKATTEINVMNEKMTILERRIQVTTKVATNKSFTLIFY